MKTKEVMEALNTSQYRLYYISSLLEAENISVREKIEGKYEYNEKVKIIQLVLNYRTQGFPYSDALAEAIKEWFGGESKEYCTYVTRLKAKEEERRKYMKEMRRERALERERLRTDPAYRMLHESVRTYRSVMKNSSFPVNLIGAIFGMPYYDREKINALGGYSTEVLVELADKWKKERDLLVKDKMLAEMVDQMFGTLSKREQEVLKMRFDRRFTLEEVGKEIGTTKERARQIEAKALRKLGHPSRSKKIGKSIEEKLGKSYLKSFFLNDFF